MKSNRDGFYDSQRFTSLSKVELFIGICGGWDGRYGGVLGLEWLTNVDGNLRI